LSFLDGIVHKIHNGIDDVGSFVTGQPAHGPSMVPSQPPTQAPLLANASNMVRNPTTPQNTLMNNPLTRGFTHAADQINPFDNGRTWQNPQGSTPQGQAPASLLHQVTHNGVTNAAGSLVNNVTGIPSIVDAGRLGVGEITHNQPAIDNATTSLAKNLPRFLPVGATESFKNGFGQDIATAATAPFAERAAQQQSNYAQKSLNDKTSDPVHNSSVDAYASGVKTDLLNQHLQSAGIDMNTPQSQVIKKVGADATSTAANIALLGKVPGLSGASLPVAASVYGGINAASGIADTMASKPNANVGDYLKSGGLGFVVGASLPAVGGITHIAPAVARNLSSQLHALPEALRTNSLRVATSEAPIRNVALNKLKSYEGAPDVTRVEQYKQQIQAGKPIKPIIAIRDSNGNLGIEDGKHRYQAYKELGINSIPTKITTWEQIKAKNQGGYVSLPGGKSEPTLPEENGRNIDKPTSKSESGTVQEQNDLNAKSVSAKNALPLLPERTPYKENKAQLESPNTPREGISGKTEPNALTDYISKDGKNQFDAQRYVDDLTKKQEIARKGEQPNLPSRFKGIKTDLRSKFVDSFAPIEDIVNKAKKDGANIDPKHNITYQIDRALRAEPIAGQYIKDNGLHDLIKNVPDSKALDQYLIAKHAQDLEANGVKTGRNLAKDKQLIESLKSEYEPHAKKVMEYNKKLLDKTAEYGLISKETASQLKKQYPNYVPANRIFAEEEKIAAPKGVGGGKVSLSKQSVVQKIKGSNRQIESPLSSILHKTQDVIAQGERNKAASILAGYKELPNNPLSLRELEKDETVGNKPVISYLDNGETKRFETTPEVAAAAKNLSKEQLGLIGKVLSYPTRVLRLGATSLNPAFSLANLAKDQASAFINSDKALRTSVANPKVFVQALQAAFYHKGEKSGELVREGAGGTSFDIARDKPTQTIEKIRSEKNLATRSAYAVQHPIRTASDLMRAVEDTIGRTEELTRAMQYFGTKDALIKEGKSVEDSKLMGAHAARNNTVNFARAGDYGRVLNSVLPYLNAGIQGSRTLLRNLKEHPAQTATKIAITAFLPVAATTAWNISDPNRKKAYDSIKEYEKQGNIIIVPPNPKQDPKTGRWNVIKIPVSQEVANLNNIVRNGVETASHDSKINFPAMIGDLIGTGTSLNVGSTRQVLNQVTPQAVKPLVEGATDQNLFTGNQIVPDAMKNLNPKDQFNKSTSGTAKVIGNVFNISPLQIDNAIRTSTGGLGQNVLNMSDKALAGSGAIPKTDVKGSSFLTSVTNRFNSAAGTTPGSEYFSNLQQQSKDQHLNGKNYQLLNSLTSKETDQNGNPVPTDLTTKLENSAIRVANPDILAVESSAAKATAQQTGKPLDPFYNLTPDQQKTVLTIEVRKSLDNSDGQAALMKQQNAAWITPFYTNRAAYFQQTIPKNSAGQSVDAEGNPIARGALNMPIPDQSVVNAMNGAKGLGGADYSAYMAKNPQLTDYYAKLDQAVRNQHDYFNEPQYKEYPTPTTRVEQLLNQSGSLTGSAKSAIFKDPEVSNYLADIAMWQINKGASTAQYEGQDYTQKDLKNLYSIGNYDVTKLANGQYAQTSGTLSNGTGLAGKGYSTGGGAFQKGVASGKGSSSKLYSELKHAKIRRTFAKKVRVKSLSSYKHQGKGKLVFVKKPTLKYGKAPDKIKIASAKA
jgi:hypothetical protein